MNSVTKSYPSSCRNGVIWYVLYSCGKSPCQVAAATAVSRHCCQRWCPDQSHYTDLRMKEMGVAEIDHHRLSPICHAETTRLTEKSQICIKVLDSNLQSNANFNANCNTNSEPRRPDTPLLNLKRALRE